MSACYASPNHLHIHKVPTQFYPVELSSTVQNLEAITLASPLASQPYKYITYTLLF